MPSGFNVEIFRAVAKTMGINYKTSLGPWNTVRNQLENGEIDLLTGMYHSPERTRKILFSKPLITVTYSLFVRDGSEIKSIKDATSLTILVQEGDMGDDYVTSESMAKQIIRKENPAQALHALAAGEGDCALLPTLLGLFYLHESGLTQLHTTGEPLLPRDYCFAVKLTDTKLIPILNEGLSIIRKTGDYEKIYDKWLGWPETDQNGRLLQNLLFYVALPLGLIILLVLTWSWMLQCKVAAKTSQLQQELGLRMKAENDLEISREYLRSLVDSSADSIVSLDKERTITRVNPAALRAYGYTKKQLIGQSVGMFYASWHEYDTMGKVVYSYLQEHGSWRGGNSLPPPQWDYSSHRSNHKQG